MTDTNLWLTSSKSNKKVVSDWTSFCKEYKGDINNLRNKKHNIVGNVFDHVTPRNASQYIEIAKVLPEDLHSTAVLALKEWDAATGGTPSLDGLSLTATKYLGTLGKLWSQFGKALYSMDQWYEIGGGFGGFASMICKCFAETLKSYIVYDLPEVASLQNRIFKTLSLSLVTSLPYTDPLGVSPYSSLGGKTIAVSEHAWSECPTPVRNVYARDVFSLCDYGFLTNNFGLGTSTHANTVDVLTSLGKAWKDMPTPTSARSYTIVWSVK